MGDTDGEDGEDAENDQAVERLPLPLPHGVLGVRGGMPGRPTNEAICARDADKLECMLQGLEYKAQGYQSAQRWIDNSRGRLTTETGLRLAEELLSHDPLDWLRSALGES